MLRKAIEIAVKAHKNQVDKGGMDYICHPITVALKCNTEEQKIVALLHDVVEDTDTTIEDLEAEGFNESILHALAMLSHDKNEPYMEYIDRLIKSRNQLAIYVKMMDLQDNMDASRGQVLTNKMFRYIEAYNKLVDVYERK